MEEEDESSQIDEHQLHPEVFHDEDFPLGYPNLYLVLGNVIDLCQECSSTSVLRQL